MASTKIGAMRIDIGADSAQFDKAMTDVQRNLAKVGGKFEAIGSKTADWGKKITAGITLPIAGLAVAAVQGAQSQAAAMAQVEAAITSMGNQAKLSGDALSSFADQLELKSLFDADEILKSSTANLLTFGNIAGDTFLKAQQAAVDLATRMGGDLQGATIMVGKALNDPVKGLTALSRAGIQFTEQQKAQIKAMQEGGNIAGAQAIMLGELNKQFGGAAEAAAKADPMREVMVKLGQAGDVIGEKLVPIIPVVTEAIGKALDAFTALSPEMQQTVVIGGGIAAAFGPALLAIGGLATGVGKAIPLLSSLAPVILTVVKAMAAFALTPVGAVITGIAVAVGAVYLAWKNWDKITAIAANLYNGVKTWIVDKLGAVWTWLDGKLKAVGQWFFNLYDAVVGHSYIPDMVDEIGDHMRRLQHEMVDPAEKTTKTTAEKFRDMAGEISGIMDGLYPETAALRGELEKLAVLESDRKTPLPALMRQRQIVADAADRSRQEQLGGTLEKSPGALDDAWASVQRTTQGIGDQMQVDQEMQDRFRDNFRGAFSDGIHAALNGDLKGLFKSWIADTAARGLQTAIDSIGNALARMFSGGGGGGSGGILGGLLRMGGTFAGGGASRIELA
ncbi:hypothetical protein NUH86_03910 [Sphingobium sp. JS3065]|uniref:hypothetical protein n=1 Tax=Sphingobium sp. JS3065 TaxID=2970925 RepID=UPI002264EDFB|nr:hypothetical protein [Sphingobium sp. JS3065]UZW55948.1 hypothetical protein NUH86_03910 [Sphingobium sp. JS3065]